MSNPKTIAEVRKMSGPDIANWLIQMADVYDRMVDAETKLVKLQKEHDEYVNWVLAQQSAKDECMFNF